MDIYDSRGQKTAKVDKLYLYKLSPSAILIVSLSTDQVAMVESSVHIKFLLLTKIKEQKVNAYNDTLVFSIWTNPEVMMWKHFLQPTGFHAYSSTFIW